MPFHRLGIPGGARHPMVDFVLDDAYITYRYGAHLAAGAGPVWNVGDAPVEGYTSGLWMVLSALAAAVGLSPIVSAKVLSIAALAGLVTLIHRAGGTLRTVAVLGVVLSPAFLLVATQGMETGLAALLATLSMSLFLDLWQGYSRPRFALLHLTGFLGALTRPELALFWVALSLALVVAYARDGKRREALDATWMTLLLAALPGLLYLVWRAGYYGHALPTTFFAKRTSGWISDRGASMLGRFLLRAAAPYALLLALAIRAGRRRPGMRRLLAGLVAIGLFLSTGLFFEPIQGYAFRFQMPVLPSLLLLLAVASPWLRDGLERRKALRPALLVLGIVVPLSSAPLASKGLDSRWQHDRAIMGQQLARFAGRNLHMLVSESGALPYYSGWAATDTLGLNHPVIARDGLTAELLQQLDPDLIMLMERGQKPLTSYGPAYDLALSDRYRQVATVAKTDPDLEIVNDHRHHYWVRQDSQAANALEQVIRSAPVILVDPDDRLR